MKNYGPIVDPLDVPTKKYIDDLIAQLQSAISRAQSAAQSAASAAQSAQSAANTAASSASSAQSAAEQANTNATQAINAAGEAKTAAEAAQATANGKAPTDHASTQTTYGAATGSNYGHVKLSASVTSSSGTTGKIAATPSAVKKAYDLANTANTNATLALDTRLNGYRIIIGSFSMTFATTTQNLTVNFGVTFAEKPAVVCTQVFDSMNIQIRDNYITTTQFRATLAAMTGSGSRTVWFIAVGKA